MGRTNGGRQLDLPLPPPPADSVTPHAPASIVAKWVYCPRLAYLEWVEGEWADTAETIEGARVHKKVDRSKGRLPSVDNLDDLTTRVQSVTLSSERLGVIAKMDVVEVDDGIVVPIEFKKGKRPHVAAGAYGPARVQVCAQGMILEDNGYRVTHGALWYTGSREKVRVIFDSDLRSKTLDAISRLRLAAASRTRPSPLQNSSKCVRCSLAGICLPDETNSFRTGYPPRQLNPADDPAKPLYVQEPGARVRKRGDELLVETDDDRVAVPMTRVSHVCLFGPVSLTTPALHALMRSDVAVSWFSTGGWFLGHTIGTGNGNVGVREAQYRLAFDQRRCLLFARHLVNAKIRNSRTLLRRNWRKEKDDNSRDKALISLKRTARRAQHAKSVSELLGIEGEAASIYFSRFSRMLGSDTASGVYNFSFARRNRRPPTDPINAMLSFVYAVLVRVMVTSLSATGLDPYMGLYHRPRHGRPALALDLMEPFRSVVGDSCVVQVVNNREIGQSDFVYSGSSCALRPRGRKALLRAFERRLEKITTHPLFGYRVSMRRLIDVQARLLARHFQGEVVDYTHYLPR